MGVLTRLAAWWLGKMTPEQWFEDFGDWNKSAAGISITQIRAMQATAVMACVSILSEDVAKLPVHVYRKLPNGGKEIVKDNPLERVLQKPNETQTRFEFVEMMQAALLLRGNAYAAIIRNGRGVPVKLIPLNPDWVSIFEAPGELFYSVARNGVYWTSELSSLPIMVPSEDMLHLRWLTLHGIVGLSRITLARDAIGLSLAQEEHAAQLFGNGARPGGILTTDKKLSADSVARLKAQWKENFGGDKKGSTAVLEEGLTWTALGMTNSDAEALASREFQAEEIARMFRVPPHKLGLIRRTMAASIPQLDQDYMNNTISSYLERWEAKLDDKFGLTEAGLFSQFDVSRFLRADLKTRLDAARVGIISMVYTPNEARRGEDLPDIDGGDQLYQPVNVAPIGFTPTAAGGGPGSDVSGAPAAGGDGDPANAPDDSAPQG